ncbi:MAG: magnesium chelatase domain-containing protein [Thermoguttaceae bacterium]
MGRSGREICGYSLGFYGSWAKYAIVGELALDGTTRPTKGALSMAIATAEDKNVRGLIVYGGIESQRELWLSA